MGCFKSFSDITQYGGKKLYLAIKEVFALSYNGCYYFCIRTLKCKMMCSAGGERSTNHSLFHRYLQSPHNLKITLPENQMESTTNVSN